MKRLVLFLSFTVLIFSVQDLCAQGIRERMKQAIFKEPVEIKDKDSTAVIEVDDPTEPSSAHVTDAAMMKALGLTDNVPYESKYGFDAYIQMEITSYKKNGNVDSQVAYDNYLHKEGADYAMVFRDGKDQSTIIFDTKNLAMLILSDSDGEKTGFATSIDPKAWEDAAEDYAEEQQQEEVDWEDYKPLKTGKTKTILGYSCDEYLAEDEETEVHMWVSEELGKELRKEWMKNQQTFGTMFVYANAMNGMVLEYDIVEKGGERNVMLVKEIDLNRSNTISTDGYTVMSLRKKTEDE